MKKLNIVKNQHYIPEALLWHFTNQDGKFYEVLLGEKRIYPTSPGNSMCETFAYEHEKLEVNTVEKFFVKFESKIAPLMQKLIKAINEYQNGIRSFSEIKADVEYLLPIFMVFYYRSGALLTEFSSFDKKHKIPLLTKKIMNWDYIVALAEMIKESYNFAIIQSDNDFLLSDQYISTVALKIKTRFFDISNRHMGLRETMILIPITSSYYAVYWHTDNDFFIKQNIINKLSDEDVRLVNQAIINNSYIKCVGLKKERIEEVLEKFNTAFPTQIYAGGNPSGYSTGAIKKKEVFLYYIDEQAFDLVELAGYKMYEKLGRNDLCACRSDKKFKKCHQDIYAITKQIMNTFGQRSLDCKITNARLIELPVDHWAGYAKPN